MDVDGHLEPARLHADVAEQIILQRLVHRRGWRPRDPIPLVHGLGLLEGRGRKVEPPQIRGLVLDRDRPASRHARQRRSHYQVEVALQCCRERLHLEIAQITSKVPRRLREEVGPVRGGFELFRVDREDQWIHEGHPPEPWCGDARPHRQPVGELDIDAEPVEHPGRISIALLRLNPGLERLEIRQMGVRHVVMRIAEHLPPPVDQLGIPAPEPGRHGERREPVDRQCIEIAVGRIGRHRVGVVVDRLDGLDVGRERRVHLDLGRHRSDGPSRDHRQSQQDFSHHAPRV